MRSGMRSWSKWVIFSRRMKSSSSVGPRRPALSEFWLSAIGDALVGRQHLAARVDAHAVERLVARVEAGRRLAVADLGRASRLAHRAGGVDRVVRLDRLAGLRRVAAIEAVLAGLERVRRHRRAGRLGADLLRRQALLRAGVELVDVALRHRRGRRAREGRQHGADAFLDRCDAARGRENSCDCALPWRS